MEKREKEIEEMDIDTLVKLLDEGMEMGSGHLEVIVTEESKDIMVTNQLNCNGSACSVPTLHKDLD